MQKTTLRERATILSRWTPLAGAAALLVPVFPAWADSGDALAPAAIAGEIAHKQKMGQLFRDHVTGKQATPPLLPQLEIDQDPSGLMALAGRAPYFHNGSGTSLETVVEFYDQRFAIGLTAQQKSDLVAF